MAERRRTKTVRETIRWFASSVAASKCADVRVAFTHLHHLYEHSDVLKLAFQNIEARRNVPEIGRSVGAMRGGINSRDGSDRNETGVHEVFDPLDIGSVETPVHVARGSDQRK